MLTDYYKLLELKPSASLFAICYRYKLLMKKHLSWTEPDRELVIAINSAFAVLSNEQVRKYYDLLFGQEFLTSGIELRPATVEKYTLIIDDFANLGKETAEKLMDDLKFLSASGLTESYIWLYLIQGMWIFGNRIWRRGPGGFLFFILGIYQLIRYFLNPSSEQLIFGLICFAYGGIVLILAYRSSLIKRMKKVTSDQRT